MLESLLRDSFSMSRPVSFIKIWHMVKKLGGNNKKWRYFYVLSVVCQYNIASIKLCTRERKNIGISISVKERIAHQLVGKAPL